MAGGNNIASEILPDTFGQLNPEQVIASSPEHVLVTSADWEVYIPRGKRVPVGPGGDAKEILKKIILLSHASCIHGNCSATNQIFPCGVAPVL